MADEQVLKCTQCGYEGRGTKDTCPVCGGRMKPRNK